MRVAQIVSTFPPYRAGIGNVAYHLSWVLSEMGHEVSVFTTTQRTHGMLDESLPFHVNRLWPWFAYGNAAFLPQLVWKLRNFDIVHLHYPFFGGAEMVYLRDSIKKCTIIVHYHMDVFGEGLLKRFFSFHSTYIMPRILSHASKIIVTSEDYARQSRIADLLKEWQSKVITVPLGVNPEVFKPRLRNKELIDKYQLRNKKTILFVGALDRAHYFKGVTYLLKAFQLIASNDDYRLLIVGGGNLQKSFESLAVNYGLERKVIFTGHVSDNWLPYYYSLADVFILPSIDSSEAFGIALLEAMSSGIPVIASDLPGVRSVVVKDETGVLVKPRQIPLMAKYLRTILENPQTGNRFGAQARERVLKMYTWDIVGRDIDRIYREFAQP